MVIAPRDDTVTGPTLVAYYRSRADVDPDELRELARQNLPGYMVPSAFMALDRFPTTTNGKVDRAALPNPPDVGRSDDHVAPASQVERLIAQVWADVIGSARVGAHDDFFKLGGHSLLAIKLVSRVRAELGVRLTLKAVYEHPRLRDLAHHIETLMNTATRPEPEPARSST